MKSTSIVLVLCLILQACSLNFYDFKRAPSSVVKVEDFKTKFAEFKSKIIGTEKDKNCSKEQLDKDFLSLMQSLKKDSCSESDFTLDRSEFNQQFCPKIKTEGLIDKIARKIIAAEKNKTSMSIFQNTLDQEFLNLYREALNLRQSLMNVIQNDAVESDERVELIALYVDSVLLPVRDLVVIKRSYQAKEKDGTEYINGLLLKLPESFIKTLSNDQSGLITQGPNPTSTPFYLELIPLKNEDNFLLQFSPNEIIRRDVITLLKAPTAKNYVLALKWMTLQMMLSQIFIYDTILDIKRPLSIPNSCQNHFNGSIPASFSFKFEDGTGDQFLENILSNHGLTFKQDDASYLDYYIDNISKDPTKDGYSGMVPFENYKNAIWGLNNKSTGSIAAQFDDQAHFQSIVNLKFREAYDIFHDIKEKKTNSNKNKYTLTYNGYEIFQQIFKSYQQDEVAEIKLRDGTTKQIYPGKQNLSEYLLELMKRNGVEDYTQLITPRLKQKFVNNRALIDFPSMYSSPVWRDWSLKTLADFVHQYRDVPTNSPLHGILANSCSPAYFIGNEDLDIIKEICVKGNRLQNLDNVLSEFRSGDTYTPTRRLEEKKFKILYPLLANFWRVVRDTTDLLPEAKPFELNFLLDQMAAGNPWARTKLSYMIALDQLEYQKEGIKPVYEFNGLWMSMDDKSKCDTKLLEGQYTKLTKAGKVFGLDKTLTYNFSGKILDSKEKEIIWRSIVDDFEHKNAQLFSVKKNNSNYYNLVENVSYKTLLTEDAALKATTNITPKAQSEIKEVGQSTEGQLSSFFLKLYNLKGNREKQIELFEKFSKVNGIDDNFKLKLNFLAVDEAYKKPIYKDLLRQAASTRRFQIIDQLNAFCEMDINNPKEFKNIFYSTTKVQNELNQLAGLPTIPEDVINKINEMSPDESRDMWWGIGSGVLGIAAVVVGGSCTVLSGGICAPLGGSMAIAGLASIGIQVKLTTNEFERKLEANESENNIKLMEELGFSNIGSSDEVHRSIAWTAIEAISIFPLLGVASRSVALGPKLVYASSKSIMQQTGKTAFKAAAKTVAEEEDVRLAKYILGVDSISKNLGIDSKSIENATKSINKIRTLYQLGEIDFETMMRQMAKILDPIRKAKMAISKTAKAELGSVVLNESREQIDSQTAKVVSTYFSDNPKAMLRVISSYSGERLNRAVRAMAELNNPARIGNKIPIYRNVTNWFSKMRNESLANNASKILRIEKELQSLAGKPGELNLFIKKNMDDLTDIFVDIPMRKREIPYVIQIQGMPAVNLFGGKKIPILSLMSEGQTLKKIFSARSRLAYEAYKIEARKSLGLVKKVKSETTFAVFKAFQYSIADLASRKTAEESGKLVAQYEQLEMSLAKKLFAEYSKKGTKIEITEFKRLVFSPKNLKEEAMAHAIWESVPTDELFALKDLNQIALKAVEELANYKDIDTFESYLNALKILVINRSPTAIEIM